MIESRQAILFEPLASEDPDAAKNDQKFEPELMLVKQQPVTASFRSTIKHLRSRGGCGSRFRGFASFLFYNFTISNVAAGLSALSFIPHHTAPVIAAVVCSQLQMLWTHVVITEPSAKRWFQRVNISGRNWKILAVPTAVLAIAEQLTIIFPAYLFLSYGLDESMTPEKLAALSCNEAKLTVLKYLSVGILFLVHAFLVVIPANVSLTRVQASLLAENEETIVPFDRSFGGKVVPESQGGSGAIGMVDAWKTFDWNSRIRLIKAYAKAFAMQIVLTFLMAGVVVFEMIAITGGDFQKYIPDNGSNKEIHILPIKV